MVITGLVDTVVPAKVKGVNEIEESVVPPGIPVPIIVIPGTKFAVLSNPSTVVEPAVKEPVLLVIKLD